MFWIDLFNVFELPISLIMNLHMLLLLNINTISARYKFSVPPSTPPAVANDQVARVLKHCEEVRMLHVVAGEVGPVGRTQQWRGKSCTLDQIHTSELAEGEFKEKSGAFWCGFTDDDDYDV